MRKSLVLFIVIFLIPFSVANSKTYKSRHNITLDIPTGYFLTSPIKMEDMIKVQEEIPGVDVERLKQIMKAYEASNMKIEYIIDIKNPDGPNSISIMSDPFSEETSHWKWRDINKKNISSECAFMEIEYTRILAKPIRLDECKIPDFFKFKNSIFLRSNGLVPNSETTQIVVYREEMFAFTLTCIKKNCKEWKKNFEIIMSSVQFH
jgi:hypothetical protein